ncbi:HdeD family acid-resistance protein [Kangiella sp. TOML190]|uniref:HdeD family acid-resistance protein n=1 Tax=Kangiella sp. TOML190 TaxID=2931351 RepID=UPI0020400E8D|nr:DUF308 domain-containing protein [Kangiella sp. TOML190]
MDQVEALVGKKLQAKQTWLLVAGILAILGGVITLFHPVLTTLSLGLVLGSLLIIIGASDLVGAFRPNFSLWVFLIGLVTFLAGLALVLNPRLSIASILTILIIYLWFRAASELLFALRVRPLAGWGWIMFSGIVTLVLAILVTFNAFELGTLYIGFVIGFQLLLFGVSLLIIRSMVKKAG